jgi:hypothetical protein
LCFAIYHSITTKNKHKKKTQKQTGSNKTPQETMKKKRKKDTQQKERKNLSHRTRPLNHVHEKTHPRTSLPLHTHTHTLSLSLSLSAPTLEFIFLLSFFPFVKHVQILLFG